MKGRSWYDDAPVVRQLDGAQVAAARVDLAAFDNHQHMCGRCQVTVAAEAPPEYLCDLGRALLTRFRQYSTEVVLMAQETRRCPLCNGGGQ